jgi:lysophospholipase L1-like esterase
MRYGTFRPLAAAGVVAVMWFGFGPEVSARGGASSAKSSTQASLDRQAVTPAAINDGSSAYWMVRDFENVLRAQQNRGADVLFLGDSITDGFKYGAGAPVWDLFFDPFGADDFAISGLTTSHVLWQVQTGEVAALAPRVVVLMIGTNNLSMGQTPGAVATGIAVIVSALQQQLPDTKVLILGIFPRGQSANDPYRAQVKQVNQQLAKLADGERVWFVDFGFGFLEDDGSISSTVMPDYLHPSLYGYQIYTVGVWGAVMELLMRP